MQRRPGLVELALRPPKHPQLLPLCVQHKLAHGFDPEDEAVQRIVAACKRPSPPQHREASPDSADLLQEGSCTGDQAMEEAEQGCCGADAVSLPGSRGAGTELAGNSWLAGPAAAEPRAPPQDLGHQQQGLNTQQQQQQQEAPAALQQPVRIKLESPEQFAAPGRPSKSKLDLLLSAVEAEEEGASGKQQRAPDAEMLEAQASHRLNQHDAAQAAERAAAQASPPAGLPGLAVQQQQRQAASANAHDAQHLLAERRNMVLQRLVLALRGWGPNAPAGGLAAQPQPSTPQQQQQQQQQPGPFRAASKAELLRMASQASHLADVLDAQARSAAVAALLQRFQPLAQQAAAGQGGGAESAGSPALLGRLLAVKQLLQLHGSAAAGSAAATQAPGTVPPTTFGGPDLAAAVPAPASVSLQPTWLPQAWLPGQTPFSAALDLQRRSSGALISGRGSSSVAAMRSLSEPLPSGLLLPGVRTASVNLSLSRSSSSGFTRFSTQGSSAGAAAGVAANPQQQAATLVRGLLQELPDASVLASSVHP